MRRIIRQINGLFIVIILVAFYFLVIGFAFVIYKLFYRPRKIKDTYWEDVKEKHISLQDFQSPY